MENLLGYYAEYMYEGHIYVGRIDTIYGYYYIIDDDGYGYDSTSHVIEANDIIDISIDGDSWAPKEPEYVNTWLDEEIRYELINATFSEDYERIDELLEELKNLSSKGIL